MDIPGYYYDPHQKRYFKIEGNTAPATSAWSLENSRKRQRQESRAKAESSAEATNRKLAQGGIKRAHVLADPLMGGLLERELGIANRLEVPNFAFGGSLVNAGFHKTHEKPEAVDARMEHVCIVRDEMGMNPELVFADNGGMLTCGTLRRDKNGKVFNNPFKDFSLVTTPDHIRLDWGISSIQVHSPTKKLFVYMHQRSSDEGRLLCQELTRVPVDEQHSQPWLTIGPNWEAVTLPERNAYSRRDRMILSPEASSSSCLLSSNYGIIAVDRGGGAQWLFPSKKKGGLSGPRYRMGFTAMEYQCANHNVIFTGAGGRLYTIDQRQEDWHSTKIDSPIAHIRSLSENEILVSTRSGSGGSMKIYDLRSTRYLYQQTVSKPTRDGNGAMTPLVNFAGCTNFDHTEGLDVDLDMGLVAVGQADAGVALYSLQNGQRVPSPGLTKRAQHAGRSDVVQWHQVGDDSIPSLLVGEGAEGVRVYSHGIRPGIGAVASEDNI